jgi:hypothetical protein
MICLTKTLIRTALCAALLGSAAAQAGSLHYTIAGTADSGSLSGTSYTGTLSVDNSALTGVGTEQVTLSSLSFTLLGNTYTAADGTAPPVADFLDGVFFGAEFNVTSSTPDFSLSGGEPGVDLPYFAYVFSDIDQGFGSLTYTLSTNNAVPEPLSLALFGVGWAALRLSRRSPFSA